MELATGMVGKSDWPKSASGEAKAGEYMAWKQVAYVRGTYAEAATSLIDHLRGKGILAAVGYNSKRGNRTLTAHVDKGQLKEVPETWHGFKVIASDEPAGSSAAS